ncbi:hypothetical protein AVEN_259161-1 [Araneus ventricosus]|uniref:MATH domain-containing protein n=1 Tax=Araneus ventricosus TaxID=182803 RepID=A0A4Y2RRU9_ARAVE|nr:hypothetical protein AVEN_259161-1 [Araneus ventricosus]
MIATSDAYKGVPFTCLWTIENVPKLTPIDLKSPRFVAHSIRKETWYLQIVESEVSENAGNCFCCRLRVDEETLQTDDENLLQEISSIVTSSHFFLMMDPR